MKPRQQLRTVVALGAVAAALMAPALTSAAGRTANATASTSVNILRPLSVSVVQNLSSGAVQTQGNSATGEVIVPATYPTLPSPKPTYVNAKQGPPSPPTPGTKPPPNPQPAPANAAQVSLTGSPGQAFTLSFQNWTEVSGPTGSTGSATTYYSPGNSSTNAPRGVLDASGQATIYIGATVTLPRNNANNVVVLRPNFTVAYN